jgi:hypothetical protein
MRCKALQLALWTLGASLSTGSCLAIDANKISPATGVAALPEVFHSWPWLALGGILLLLTVIALAARRRLPFGPQR